MSLGLGGPYRFPYVYCLYHDSLRCQVGLLCLNRVSSGPNSPWHSMKILYQGLVKTVNNIQSSGDEVIFFCDVIIP